eukprot:COSAG06_NODE_30752_length_533_cov_0.573733_1_plen_119_part_10
MIDFVPVPGNEFQSGSNSDTVPVLVLATGSSTQNLDSKKSRSISTEITSRTAGLSRECHFGDLTNQSQAGLESLVEYRELTEICIDRPTQRGRTNMEGGARSEPTANRVVTHGRRDVAV